jgi:hypothetical protein
VDGEGTRPGSVRHPGLSPHGCNLDWERERGKSGDLFICWVDGRSERLRIAPGGRFDIPCCPGFLACLHAKPPQILPVIGGAGDHGGAHAKPPHIFLVIGGAGDHGGCRTGGRNRVSGFGVAPGDLS